MKNILIVVACLVAGYALVSMLTGTKTDNRRPPPDRDNPPPPASGTTRALPPPPSGTPRALPSPRAHDWTLVLDVPRSANIRDIEAAFRRQQNKAAAADDRAMLEKLQLARDAALAEKRNG